MPATPYAKLLLTINGGAPTSGGIQSVDGAVIQPNGESTVGWTQQLYEIYDYPTDFPAPAGWTKDATTGTISYSTTAIPPPFTLSGWNRPFMLRLTVNRGLNGSGNADPTLVDSSTAILVPSPNVGLLALGFQEENQFSASRAWTANLDTNFARIDASLAGGAAVGLSNAAPANVATAAAAGAAVTASRSDHAHALPFATVQSVLNAATGAVGFNSQALTGVASETFVPVAAPAAPASGWTLYANTATGCLEAIDSSGRTGIVTETIRITNPKTLSANNTTATVNVFKLTGSIRVKKLMMVATSTIGASHTSPTFGVSAGGLTQLSTPGSALSNLPAGSIAFVPGTETTGTPDATTVVSTAAAAVNLQAVGQATFQPFEIAAENGTTTYIGYRFTTTLAPSSDSVEFICEYERLTDDGALTAA